MKLISANESPFIVNVVDDWVIGVLNTSQDYFTCKVHVLQATAEVVELFIYAMYW